MSSMSFQPPTAWWQGASGHWYIFSVYSLYEIPTWLGSCNYIFAERRFGGGNSHRPLYVGEKGDTDRFERHEKLDAARRLGAGELHVHLLAGSPRERLDIETDIRHAHWTPLNDQATPARPHNALAALTAASGVASGAPPFGAPRGALFGGPTMPHGPIGNALLDALEPKSGATPVGLAALGWKPVW